MSSPLSRSPFAFGLAFALAFALSAPPARASAETDAPWTGWLRLGPVAVPPAAFAERASAEPRLEVAGLWPVAGDRVSWPGRGELRWESLYVGAGKLVLGPEDLSAAHAAEVWLASYVGVARFTKLALELDGGAELSLWLDGEPLALESLGSGKQRARLALTTGDHLLVLRSFRPQAPGLWELGAHWKCELGDERPSVGTQPARRLRLDDVIDVDEVEGLELAPDGKHLAIRYVFPAVPAPHSARWLEIRRVADGGLVRSTRGAGALSGFAWGPQGDRFAFTERASGGVSIWIEELASGERRRVAEGLQNFAGLRWKPSGDGFVIALSTESPADPRGVQLLRGFADRLPGARERTQLFELSLSGIRRRLTGGDISCELQDLSKDGKRALIERAHQDRPPRELVESELCELDLENLTLKPLFRTSWFSTARYDKKGERLLVLAGPSAFGGAGRGVPEGVVANDYDMQAYLVELASGAVEPLTKDAALTVEWGAWSETGEQLVFRAQLGSYVRHLVYELASKTWRELPATSEVATSSTLGADVLACAASGAVEPTAIHVQTAVAGGAPRVLLRPNEARLAHLRLGAVETYRARLASGEELDGYVLLPVDFDPSRRYPCIVNYYAGTAPVSRDFAGRYPRSWWAAQGYVVYVLQPSGSTGFGQAFSARHVNNWGRITTGEIVECVQRFLDAHPYVDRAKVGCIGASYGGFSTLLLLTHTELFAGAVSHAGISSLASYWGEGYWGATYSAVASANSFPWNARELYVEQSALYRADRIKTPLLLIHGTVDTNVPVGESEQMYTALRLLGREVEYLRVEGENHHVVSYAKRKLWMQSIVAWFDRTLKGEPEWWKQLYDGRG
ncbi:MAG: S9 family peptidase [Planctomycetes bacterium]|nr:S9 family peptidase [Planctomycetota bacterium]